MLLFAAVMLLGSVTAAGAGTVKYWTTVQPKGNVSASVPVVLSGNAVPDGKPFVASSVKLFVDGVQIARNKFTASIGSTNVYVYYVPQVRFTDGPHTFRVEVSDSAGKLSFNEWSATVVQPPSATWLAPEPDYQSFNGRPTVALALSDNTPASTFVVAGQVRSGSSSGPVVAAFGGTGLPFGTNAFELSEELAPGTYYLTATVTDSAGNGLTLAGSSARRFSAVVAPAMSLLEECDACHPSLRVAHPTPATTDCGVCHPDKVDDHMEGTDYCEDCHYDGWHTNGAGVSVTVSSSCVSCHNATRPDVPRHTAENTSGQHQSSCEGCHQVSLTDRHSVTADGSAYAYQCSLCHSSTSDTDVQSAVASGDTSCVACHAEASHLEVVVSHTATGDASLLCASAGCHANTDTIALHANRPEGRCAVCHNNPVGGDLTADKISKDCSGCHATSSVDYHRNMAVHVTPPEEYETCGRCHHGWGSNPTRGPDVTRHAGGCATCHNDTLDLTFLTTRCASCHNEEGVDYHYETAARHAPVDPASVDCARCHGTTDVRVLHEEPGCATCHSSYTCTECHSMHNGEPGTALESGLTCTKNCHTTQGTDYHTGFSAAHTFSALGSGCQAQGCHSNSLTTAHEGFVGEGNRYPQYPDTCALCHLNEDPLRIPDGATADCSTCHAEADHEAVHTVQRLDDCASCHAGGSLTALHIDGEGLTCDSCHLSTDADVTAAIASGNRDCGACHDAAAPHGDDTAIHTATLGSDAVHMFDNHDGMGNLYYWVECSTCHVSNVLQIHGSECAVCHGEGKPRETFATWNKGCQQAGCHAVIHEYADAGHEEEYRSNDCETNCHNSDWAVPSENCLFCHESGPDTTPPVTTLGHSGPFVGVAQISLVAVDESGPKGVRRSLYQLDGGPVTEGQTVRVEPPASGSAMHSIVYWSVDWAGNIEPAKSALFSVSPDTAPPSTTSNALASYVGPATIKLTPTDNATTQGVAHTYYRLDGGQQAEGTSIPVAQPASGSQSHTLEFWSVDTSGNTESVKSVSFTITADLVAPSTTTNLPAYTRNSSITAYLYPVDPAPSSGISSVYMTSPDAGVVSGPWLSGSTWYCGLYSLRQGQVRVQYWSVDKAGNIEGQKSHTFIADWSAPVTTASPTGSTFAGPTTITLSPTDAYSGVASTYYRLDGGAQTAGTSVNVTAPGSHTLVYWSVDRAGNTEYQKTKSFSISAPDTTAPTTTSSFNPASGAVYNSARSVTLSASDNTGGSGVAATYYRIDGGAWTTGSSFTITGDGLHTFSWYSRDNAGNTEAIRTSNEFRIDTAAPSTTCDAVSGHVYTGNQTFELTATDAGSGVASTWYRIDSGAWTQGTAVAVVAPSSGSVERTIEWYSRDAATNQEPTKSVTFTVQAGEAAGTATFNYTGDDQSFTVPDGINEISVDVFGAQGGDIDVYSGGLGGRVQGTLSVTPGQVLTIKVGERPAANPSANGGWPNGGDAGGSCGSAGGGSSAILYGSTIWVEAGAGGGADHEGYDGGPGGYQGWLPGGGEQGGYGAGAGGGGGWNGGSGYSEHDGGGDGGSSYIAQGTGTLTSGVREGNGLVVITWGGGGVSDTEAPTTSSSFNPTAGSAFNSARSVTLSANDGTGSGVAATYYRIDSGAWTAGTSFTVSGDGLHTFSWYSRDNAGNVEQSHTSNQFRIDATAPTTACSAVSGQTYTGNQTFTLSATDAGSGVAGTWYKLDGGAWTQGTSVSVTAPASGSASHTIYWYSRDNATNQEVTKSVTFSVAAAGAQPATLLFRWHPADWAEATLHVENASGQTIASTQVWGYDQDLDWAVQVPAGQTYYMVCDYYYDDWTSDEGGGYGMWSNATSINPDGILSPGETVIWDY